MAIINRKTATFSAYMDAFKDVARNEYQFELGFDYNEKEIYELYQQNMDVYEAIEAYKEQLVD